MKEGKKASFGIRQPGERNFGWDFNSPRPRVPASPRLLTRFATPFFAHPRQPNPEDYPTQCPFTIEELLDEDFYGD